MQLSRLVVVCFLFLFLHHISLSISLPESIISYLPVEIITSVSEVESNVKELTPDDYYCEGWRSSNEVDNVGVWFNIPLRCESFVKDYMTSETYSSHCEGVGRYALEYAKSVNVSNDGKDVWIFSIDETLLSNIMHFLGKVNGSDPNGYLSPAIPSSLDLYNEIKKLNYKIFILTRRDERLRRTTIHNLEHAGYRDWDRLIMRGVLEEGVLVRDYKSRKRQELINEGYRIRGNMGSMWSDLVKLPLADRSFKMPNPMYYAP